MTCGASGNPAEGTAAWVDDAARARRPRRGGPRDLRLRRPGGDRRHRAPVLGERRPPARRPARRPAEGPDGPRRTARATRSRPIWSRALRRVGEFEISVAAYPETHPEARSPAADLDNLKRKLDAGATRAITQYCFDTTTVLRFRDRMAAAGITAPLAVGILPVHDFPQIKRFSEGCGAGVPAWLGALFEGLDDDPDERVRVGARVAAEQARQLILAGIRELHLYTLNRAAPTLAACRLLGLRAQPRPRRLRPHAMSDFLTALERRVLLFDGAMGTQIQGRELSLEGDFWGQENCSEVLNLSRPDLIHEIHLGYLEAGADAVETNSFGGSPVTLGEFDLGERAFEINRRAAELAREAVTKVGGDGRRRFVIGAIGPGTRLPSLGHIAYRTLEAGVQLSRQPA